MRTVEFLSSIIKSVNIMLKLKTYKHEIKSKLEIIYEYNRINQK